MKLNIRDLWQKHFQKQEPIPETEVDVFEKIVGYDGLKRITKLALESEENYNLLYQGPPSSAKTMFLEAIIEYAAIHNIPAVYFDATNMTTRMLDVLEQRRPFVICIDEIEKCNRTYQEKILNFAESGHVKVDQMTRQYNFTIPHAKIWHRICNTIMTRKDQIREGFVAHTFHLPVDIDDKIRMEAVKKRVRFSDIAILAFREFFQDKKR
jgi:hypothetical protein